MWCCQARIEIWMALSWLLWRAWFSTWLLLSVPSWPVSSPFFCTKNILLFLFLQGSGDKEKPLYDKDCQDDIEGTPQKKGVLFPTPKDKNIFWRKKAYIKRKHQIIVAKYFPQGNTYKCFRNESSDVCDICSCEICECTCSEVKEEKEEKEGEEEGRSGEEKEVETTKAQCKNECDKKAGGEGKQGEWGFPYLSEK